MPNATVKHILDNLKSDETQMQRSLNDLIRIHELEVCNSVILPRKDFVKSDVVQTILHECAVLTENKSLEHSWEFFDEYKCGALFADCFRMLSMMIIELENEISDNKQQTYQCYANVFASLLKISNKLLLRFIGKFSEAFLEKKGLVAVLTFLKIKHFLNKLKTNENRCVLISLIEHLRIQSRYADKDQKLWLNFYVFDSLLDLSQTIGEAFEDVDNIVQAASYTVMANIGTDKQIERNIKCSQFGDAYFPIYR